MIVAQVHPAPPAPPVAVPPFMFQPMVQPAPVVPPVQPVVPFIQLQPPPAPPAAAAPAAPVHRLESELRHKTPLLRHIYMWPRII